MKKLACNESQRVHFAGSGESLPDIAKSRDASMDNKDFRSLLISLLKILMKQNGQLSVLSHKLPCLI